VCTVGGESLESISSELGKEELLDSINEALTDSALEPRVAHKTPLDAKSVLLMSRPVRTDPSEAMPSFERYEQIVMSLKKDAAGKPV
jgi:hypothetical protein